MTTSSGQVQGLGPNRHCPHRLRKVANTHTDVTMRILHMAHTTSMMPMMPMMPLMPMMPMMPVAQSLGLRESPRLPS